METKLSRCSCTYKDAITVGTDITRVSVTRIGYNGIDWRERSRTRIGSYAPLWRYHANSLVVVVVVVVVVIIVIIIIIIIIIIIVWRETSLQWNSRVKAELAYFTNSNWWNILIYLKFEKHIQTTRFFNFLFIVSSKRNTRISNNLSSVHCGAHIWTSP